jgi:hypothetical protein
MISTTDPYDRILAFLDQSQSLFFDVAPQLYSQGRVNPVPDFSENTVMPGIKRWTSGSAARNSVHQTTEEVTYLYLFHP